MRNVFKFILMLPMVIGSMLLAAILVGMSVTIDSLGMSDRTTKPRSVK